MKRDPRVVVVPIVAVLVLGGGLAWRVQARHVAESKPAGGSAVVEGTSVAVGARALGRLTEVLVLPGDVVRRGQLLAKLDCVDQTSAVDAAVAQLRIAEAQADAAEVQSDVTRDDAKIASSQAVAARAQNVGAEAELLQVTRDDERVDRLYRDDAVPLLERERADTRKKESEATSAGAGASLRTTLLGESRAQRAIRVTQKNAAVARATAEKARGDLQSLQKKVDECSLAAPQNGLVTERLLEPGSIVQPGTPVVKIVDLAVAKLTFYLPNAELARARTGGPAQVRVDAYPGRVFPGVIARVASEAAFTPRNVQTREDRDRLVYAVEVRVANERGELRAGMPADVVVVADGAR